MPRPRPLLGQMSNLVGVDALGFVHLCTLGALCRRRTTSDLALSRVAASLYPISAPSPLDTAPPAARRPPAPDLHPRIDVPLGASTDSAADPSAPIADPPRSAVDGRRRPPSRYGIIGIARLDGHGPPFHWYNEAAPPAAAAPKSRAARHPPAEPLLPQQSQLQRSRRRRPPVLRRDYERPCRDASPFFAVPRPGVVSILQ